MARLSALETREPDEAKHVAEMIDILRRKMARDYVAGRTLRDAHPKTTGVLRGKFVVAAGLPEELRVGIFAKARSFDCWIRTSNASGTPRSDAVPDARGLALKLLQPKGGEASGAASFGQDFVLLDTPVMPLIFSIGARRRTASVPTGRSSTRCCRPPGPEAQDPKCRALTIWARRCRRIWPDTRRPSTSACNCTGRACRSKTPPCVGTSARRPCAK